MIIDANLEEKGQTEEAANAQKTWPLVTEMLKKEVRVWLVRRRPAEKLDRSPMLRQGLKREYRGEEKEKSPRPTEKCRNQGDPQGPRLKDGRGKGVMGREGGNMDEAAFEGGQGIREA